MFYRSIEINYFYFVPFVNSAHGSQFSIPIPSDNNNIIVITIQRCKKSEVIIKYL